ncbi:MAG TPA: hypothetical protein VF144_15385 [Chitinophagaceae bacterium]
MWIIALNVNPPTDFMIQDTVTPVTVQLEKQVSKTCQYYLLMIQQTEAKGNSFEIYLNDPAAVKSPSEIRTDIYQPLE